MMNKITLTVNNKDVEIRPDGVSFSYTAKFTHEEFNAIIETYNALGYFLEGEPAQVTALPDPAEPPDVASLQIDDEIPL